MARYATACFRMIASNTTTSDITGLSDDPAYARLEVHDAEPDGEMHSPASGYCRGKQAEPDEDELRDFFGPRRGRVNDVTDQNFRKDAYDQKAEQHRADRGQYIFNPTANLCQINLSLNH